MFNAACKILTAAALLTAVGTSCSKDKSEDALTPDDAIAQINTALDNCQYDSALVLIDSFNVKYANETDLRKQCIGLKARAIEGQTIREIEVSDSTLAVNQLEIDSLQALFVKVQNAVSPYYVVREVSKGSLVGRSAIEPRLGDNDTPWLLAVNVAGQKTNITAVSFSDSTGKTIADVMTSTADRAVKGSDGTSTFFSPEEAEAIGKAMMENPRAVTAAVSDGSKVITKIQVNEATARAIATTYRLATLREERQTQLINREKLERKLQIARDQMANNLPVNVTQ